MFPWCTQMCTLSLCESMDNLLQYTFTQMHRWRRLLGRWNEEVNISLIVSYRIVLLLLSLLLFFFFQHFSQLNYCVIFSVCSEKLDCNVSALLKKWSASLDVIIGNFYSIFLHRFCSFAPLRCFPFLLYISTNHIFFLFSLNIMIHLYKSIRYLYYFCNSARSKRKSAGREGKRGK